jgi:hypothetical protein
MAKISEDAIEKLKIKLRKRFESLDSRHTVGAANQVVDAFVKEAPENYSPEDEASLDKIVDSLYENNLAEVDKYTKDTSWSSALSRTVPKINVKDTVAEIEAEAVEKGLDATLGVGIDEDPLETPAVKKAAPAKKTGVQDTDKDPLAEVKEAAPTVKKEAKSAKAKAAGPKEMDAILEVGPDDHPLAETKKVTPAVKKAAPTVKKAAEVAHPVEEFDVEEPDIKPKTAEEKAHEAVQKLKPSLLSRSGKLQNDLDKVRPAGVEEEVGGYRKALDEANKRAELIAEDYRLKEVEHKKITALTDVADEMLTPEDTRIRDNVTHRELKAMVLAKRTETAEGKEIDTDVTDKDIANMVAALKPEEKFSLDNKINKQVKKEEKKLKKCVKNIKGENLLARLSQRFFPRKEKLETAKLAVDNANRTLQDIGKKTDGLIHDCEKIQKDQGELAMWGGIKKMQGKGHIVGLRRSFEKFKARIHVGADHGVRLAAIKRYEENLTKIDDNLKTIKEEAKKYDKAEKTYVKASRKYKAALTKAQSKKEKISGRIDRSSPTVTKTITSFRESAKKREAHRRITLGLTAAPEVQREPSSQRSATTTGRGKQTKAKGEGKGA